jgi:hypothetical protein
MKPEEHRRTTNADIRCQFRHEKAHLLFRSTLQLSLVGVAASLAADAEYQVLLIFADATVPSARLPIEARQPAANAPAPPSTLVGLD